MILLAALLTAGAVLLVRALDVEHHLKPTHVVVVQHFKVVMLGDSLTQWTDWNKLLPGVNCLNLGIAGQKTAEIELRLDNVLAATPSVVVLLAGTNDVLQHTPLELTFDSYSRMVSRLRKNGIRVVITAVPYVGSQYRDSRSVNAEIARLNERLRVLAGSKDLAFVDLPKLMPNVEKLRVSDGIHLNGLGYQVWASALKPLLPTQ